MSDVRPHPTRPVRDAPAPFAALLVMLTVPVIIVAAWLLLPGSAVGVAVLFVIAIAAVFGAIWRVLALRRVQEPPGRHPTPPPSQG